MYDLVAKGRSIGPYLDKLYRFLESSEFILAMQTITDNKQVNFADYQATKFTAGCFLKTHNDYVAGKNRHAAYVLSLTSDWNPDWGGLLTFPSTDSPLGNYLLPGFNRLYVFSVPQPHSVSMVTELALNPRLSITGWLRSR
jgi:Rps23 Pro-64 3,4-dihydroxylase Tpa1-like proline 4-hydroxylase